MHGFELDLLNRSRSCVNMTIESQYMTFYFSAIIMFFLHNFQDIHSWKYASPLPWSLKWVKFNVNIIIESPCMTYYLMAILILPYLSLFSRHSLSKLAWPWPLELVKVKCKYANRRTIPDLLVDSSINLYHLYHHFQVIHSLKCARP